MSNSDSNVADAVLTGTSLYLSAIDLGSAIITLTADDGCGGVTDHSFLLTVNVESAMAGAIIFAIEEAEIKKETQIYSGNILVNEAIYVHDDEDDDEDDDDEEDDEDHDDYELKMDKDIVTAGGYVVKANGVQIKNDTEVGGDVYYNNLHNQGTIFGQEISPVAFPLYSNLPPFKSAPYGNQNIVVQKNGYLVLEPGDYKNITVKDRGTLLFTGGVYNVKKITLKKKADLIFGAAVEIRVDDKLQVKKQGYVGPDAGSGIDASDVIFYISGDDDAAKLEEKVDFYGTIYAPYGEVELKKEVFAAGAFLALEVEIDKECELSLDSYFGGSGLARSDFHSFEDRIAIPETFTLNQNYPNPFNPATTISYGIPVDSDVSIIVYDLQGREVQRLVNEFQYAGNHEVHFTAENLSSGTYLYVVKTTDHQKTSKMVYLK